MTIALFGKNFAPENAEHLRQLLLELAENQVEITVFKPFTEIIAAFVPENVKYSVFHSNADLNADLLFSIGGDGTILDAVPLVLDSGMPVAVYINEQDPSAALSMILAWSEDGAPCALRLVMGQQIEGEYNRTYWTRGIVSIEVI